MARIQSSVSPQRPNPLTVAMVHTGYLKFATERNIVPNRNAAHHEKARTTLLVDRNQGVNAWNSKGGTRMADDESCIDFAGPARSPGMAAQLHRDAQLVVQRPPQSHLGQERACGTDPYQYKYRRDARIGPIRTAEQQMESYGNRQSNIYLILRRRLQEGLAFTWVWLCSEHMPKRCKRRPEDDP